MSAMTIRNISPETHRALKARAKAHFRSTEAEVRAILDAAVDEPGRVRLGTLLQGVGESVGGVDLSIPQRDALHGDPIDFR